MYTHCGTHIDTLNHLGYFGCFWNGWRAEERLCSRHWRKGGAEKYPPLIDRGVLLDIAGPHGVNCLAEVDEVTPGDLKNALRDQGTEKQYELAFFGFPLKLTGATGSPIRPIAVPLCS
jgi:Putative cyclase